MRKAETAEEMAHDPLLRQSLYLISKGIPFDIAFLLDPEESVAWCVIFGEQDGGRFDWRTMQWKDAEDK